MNNNLVRACRALILLSAAASAHSARLRNGTHLEWRGGEGLSRIALYDEAGTRRGVWTSVGGNTLLPLPAALPRGVYRTGRKFMATVNLTF